MFFSTNDNATIYCCITFQNLPKNLITNTERKMKVKIENVLQGMYDNLKLNRKNPLILKNF